MTKKTSIILGILGGLTIGIVSYAFDDPIASLRAKNNLTFKQLQSQQYKVKQEQTKEKELLREYCLGLKDTAKVLLEEGDSGATKEQIKEWEKLKTQGCVSYYINTLKDVYSSPDDLSFTFLKSQGTYISQNIRTHFYRNGYVATDIATGGRKLTMYAPSYMKSEGEDLERTYTVELADFPKTTGRTLILKWEENGVKMSFLLGHISTYLVQSGTVKTGDKIAISGGDPTDDDQGATTGLHTHFEYRINDIAVPYPSYLYTKHAKVDGSIEIEEVTKKTCIKKNVGDDQQKYVKIASDISGGDIRFLGLLNAENGLWSPTRVHNDGHGQGFCGIDDRWHSDIINDKRFSDPKWQIEQCYKLWKGGTKFYGDIDSQIDKFICS